MQIRGMAINLEARQKRKPRLKGLLRRLCKRTRTKHEMGEVPTKGKAKHSKRWSSIWCIVFPVSNRAVKIAWAIFVALREVAIAEIGSRLTPGLRQIF